MSKTIIIRLNYRRSLILAMLISSFSLTTACNIAVSDKQNKNCPKVANRLSADLLHNDNSLNLTSSAIVPIRWRPKLKRSKFPPVRRLPTRLKPLPKPVGRTSPRQIPPTYTNLDDLRWGHLADDAIKQAEKKLDGQMIWRETISQAHNDLIKQEIKKIVIKEARKNPHIIINEASVQNEFQSIAEQALYQTDYVFAFVNQAAEDKAFEFAQSGVKERVTLVDARNAIQDEADKAFNQSLKQLQRQERVVIVGNIKKITIAAVVGAAMTNITPCLSKN
ncbi:hypothetical protein PI95_000300 [Hassallia byssoidea VB512170]|uniref:Uncharacterized protein n=2 Tax=Hassallia TaxID=482629 RepID=A0A846H364_9CYAN|nr:hypothetical protein [Hassalia byssoidea VB512170]